MPKWFKKIAKMYYYYNPGTDFWCNVIAILVFILMGAGGVATVTGNSNSIVITIIWIIIIAIPILAALLILLYCYGDYLYWDEEDDEKENTETVLVEKTFTRNRDHFPEVFDSTTIRKNSNPFKKFFTHK